MGETSPHKRLTPEETQELLRATTRLNLTRGQVFFSPGTVGEALFVLVQGRVNIYRMTALGQKLVTATLGPGEVFGMGWVGQQTGSYAEAAEPCTLGLMTPSDMESLISSHPRLCHRLMQVLAARIQEADTRLEIFTFGSVRARLAVILNRLSREGEQDIVGITHQDLGEMVGANRETVTRILDGFRAEGLIALERRRIKVLNLAGLQERGKE